MKFNANSSVDMLTGISFFDVDPDNVFYAGKDRISLYDPEGKRQDYLGSFWYSSGELNWSKSYLSGFRQYNSKSSKTPAWEAKQLKISGAKYYEYSTNDDGYALLEYALRGNDTITGSNAKDLLFGGAGNDVIDGRAGDDIIYGGSGKDTLIGGKGKDIFLFNEYDYTGNTKQSASIIRDFSSGEKDVIAVYIEGVEKYERVSTFSGGAGQYTTQKIKNGFLLSLDSNGDSEADAFLNILGIKSFKDSYVANAADILTL